MSTSGFSKAFMPILIILSLAGVVILQAGFIFLLLALLPAVIAYYVDNHPGQPLFKTVAACNMAATLPTLFPMIEAAMRMKRYDVMALMSNPSVWMFIYLCAAAGWCLTYLCRLIARFIMVLIYEYKIAALGLAQRHLLEEWGNQLKEKNV